MTVFMVGLPARLSLKTKWKVVDPLLMNVKHVLTVVCICTRPLLALLRVRRICLMRLRSDRLSRVRQRLSPSGKRRHRIGPSMLVPMVTLLTVVVRHLWAMKTLRVEVSNRL